MEERKEIEKSDFIYEFRTRYCKPVNMMVNEYSRDILVLMEQQNIEIWKEIDDDGIIYWYGVVEFKSQKQVDYILNKCGSTEFRKPEDENEELIGSIDTHLVGKPLGDTSQSSVSQIKA